MSEFLAPLLILGLLVGAVWVLCRRPRTLSWRDNAYGVVFDAVEDAILVFDAHGRFLHGNLTARTWFGFNGVESGTTEFLQAQITPSEDFLALLARDGRAALQIGARSVEAISHQVSVQGKRQVALVLRNVTASSALPSGETTQDGGLQVLTKLSLATNADLNQDELLERVLRELKHLFPYNSAAISLWYPRDEQLIVKSCVGPALTLNEVQTPDKGCALQIVRERQPLLKSDLKDLPFRSYAGIPLLARTKIVGTLELFADRADAFSPTALDILAVIGAQVAVVLENVRLYEMMLLRADEMATMNTLSAAINASLNLDELLEIVVYSVSQAIGCDRSAIFLMDNERGMLNLAKSRGLSTEFVHQNQNIRPQLDGPGQVVLDRYPLVVGDLRQGKVPKGVASLLEREQIAAFVDLPLRGRERVLGALTVYYDRPHAFDESELELMRTIANQVTLALENARLYERTDRALARRVDQLAAIEDIGRELTSTLDITRVFNLVLQRAMGTTGASAGLLAVCDATCEELQLIVERGYPPGTLKRYWTEGWPTSNGIVGRVARTGETVLVKDVRTEPDYIVHLPDTSAQLIVPILKEEGVLGVVSLESSRPQGFSPDDVRFTTQLAELAAIAIDNARLFQQVREGRDNLQAILDSTHDGILVIGRDNRIVLANPMIEVLSGLSAQALVGQRVNKLEPDFGLQLSALLGFSASELEEALSLLDVTSDQVTKRTYEMPGSPPRHIEQVAAPVIDKDGAAVGRLIVIRDISEERQLATMRQDLTDMIIHDLRSPLTAVIGGVQVASDLIDSSADTKVIHHALDMANQSCNHLMSLVDSLLDISRLEAGQMPLERQPVLLPQLAQSVIHQMKPLAERATVTLELQAVPLIPPVFADYELISRVLVNLIDNALKHTPNKSTITIEIVQESIGSVDADQRQMEAGPALTPSAGLSSRAIRCTVLDMGPGIPPEFRQRVFERFAQLDGRRRGKGLGLAFCQLVVRAHGGRIWVDDNPQGQGSAFSFALPVVPSELFSPEGSDPAKESSQRFQ